MSKKAKAQGKSYREGLSLIDLFRILPDDAAAERWFEKQRWWQAGSLDHYPSAARNIRSR